MMTRWRLERCEAGKDNHVSIRESIGRLSGTRSAADARRCRLARVVVSAAAMLLAQLVHAQQPAPPVAQTSPAQPAVPSSQPVLAPLPSPEPAKISEPVKNYPDIPATPR